eukprot:CAMPEP_0197395714 /NCGR_PEP_ID=MMETSP1165-20131217/7226_1 /TAXON_ID=284809 /ORGANISM="Chrysocystis fragilis, Strain CCMP3189" /LENGTH=181 /DNA_ID=CAMNT_0042921485 /DNA_START=180 /DNA_END=726 /DNA_ORIENTATION=+
MVHSARARNSELIAVAPEKRWRDELVHLVNDRGADLERVDDVGSVDGDTTIFLSPEDAEEAAGDRLADGELAAEGDDATRGEELVLGDGLVDKMVRANLLGGLAVPDVLELRLPLLAELLEGGVVRREHRHAVDRLLQLFPQLVVEVTILANDGNLSVRNDSTALVSVACRLIAALTSGRV